MAARREAETARIESLTHDGRGIAAVDGKKVFVAGGLEGETVRFRRRKRRRSFDEAELLEVIDSSPARIPPRCAVFGVCGGCTLQHVSAPRQRAIRERALRDSLERIGQVEPERWLPAIFDPADDGGWHYRRRARLAVKDVAGKGRVLVGFRERHVPYVTDMHRCEVLARPVDALIDELSDVIGDLSIRSRLPQIEVTVADNATALVFRVLDPPTDADRERLRRFAAERSVQVGLQAGRPDDIEALYPEDPAPLSYRLPEFEVEVRFAATDFVQVNGAVNRLMVSAAIEQLQVERGHRVLDLYCGIGNFSLPLARCGARVLGLEGEAGQVERARDNAARNGFRSCEFWRADLDKVDGSERWMRERWDRVLIDPARSGALEVVRQMRTLGPARIVYVSCHPGTLARDAGELTRTQGYTLESAGIIDMFPHTGHLESLAVFRQS